MLVTHLEFSQNFQVFMYNQKELKGISGIYVIYYQYVCGIKNIIAFFLELCTVLIPSGKDNSQLQIRIWAFS